MGHIFEFRITPAMRERMKAGLAFFYTTRDGHEWYIDATLNFPFRQADFAEAMYDAFDGRDFIPGYPSLSVCQLALEEGCPEWHGEGWYWLGDEEDGAVWIDELEDLKERVAVLKQRFEEEGIGYFANYAGDGPEPALIY